MAVHTSSRNQRSCVTTRSAPAPCFQRPFRWPASHVMARTSKWFVGSSSASTSQSPMSSRARSTRRRCPPESVPTGASQGMSRASPAMTSRTRASPAHAYSGTSPTSAWPTVAASSKASVWPSTPTRTEPFLSTRPASTSSPPDSSASSVDLPSPLRPTMPMRSPSFTPSDTPSNTVFVGNSTRTFSHPSRNAMHTRPSPLPSAGDYSAGASPRRMADRLQARPNATGQAGACKRATPAPPYPLPAPSAHPLSAPHPARRRAAYTSRATTTTKAAVSATPAAIMSHTAGRARLTVQPMPKRSGRNRLGSSGLQ